MLGAYGAQIPPLSSGSNRRLVYKKGSPESYSKDEGKSTQVVTDIVEMEKLTDYTCDPEYMMVWRKLMENQNAFNEVMNNNYNPSNILMEGFGEIDVGHLRPYPNVRAEAFDMKMRITAYWKIVLKRLVDCMALHLLFSIQMLVNKDMERRLGMRSWVVEVVVLSRCWKNHHQLLVSARD
ncbi:hypothetical protein F0562_025676 [Nyssa sinensis]|uniref:Uncharacterized protein n=1 Tax=Nyssa sinensis TaxID=561372 RepID=A0A5J5B8P1_9ASTE|nr:hypothetical protein F0562_025676 [Nyssa sinensis]